MNSYDTVSDFITLIMAVASGPAGPVLAGPVFTAIFETAHAQIMNNKQHVWGPSHNLSSTSAYTLNALFVTSYSWFSYLATATATGSITNSRVQDDIPEEVHQQVN